MNKRLLILSGLAILAVVANHASLDGYIAMFWWTDRYLPVTVPNYDQIGSLSYYGLVTAQKLALFSVPAFLFVTGVFIAYAARGSQSHLTWTVVWNRIKNLLPPYLIWTTVYFLAAFILGERYTAAEYLMGYLTINGSPYFFVPLLIAYYLLSMFFAPIAKSNWKLLLALASLILLGAIVQSYLYLASKISQNDSLQFRLTLTLLPHGQFFEYFFYYSFGMIAGFHFSELKTWLFRFRWVLLASVVIMAVLAVIEAEWVYQSFDLISWRSRTLTIPTVLYTISVICCFSAFDQVHIPFSAQLYQIGVVTLGIYLIHETVLLFVPKIVYHVFPVILGYQVIYQPVLISLAVGAPMVIMALIRRSSFRRYTRILFG